MRILLDTQCWLWMHLAPDRFAADVRRTIVSAEVELFLSSASVWEIAIKHALGKLRLPVRPERYVPTRLQRSRVLALPIDHAHALRVGLLPPHHRDPFDRMIVAQAQVERLTLLTADRQLAPYDVRVMWA